MISNLLWGLAIALLLVCIFIQWRALNKMAFGRSMFIVGMAFLCSFAVALTVPSAAVWVLFIFFQLLGWAFLILVTMRSIKVLRERKAGRIVRKH